MSTKIYTAYRFPAKTCEQLWAKIEDLHKRGTAAVIARLYEVREQFVAGVDRTSAVYLQRLETKKQSGRYKDPEHQAALACAGDAMTRGYLGSQASNVRSPWDFDCSLTVYWYKGYAYLIPLIGDGYAWGGRCPFLSAKPSLTEFGYWNNTDKPRNVTNAAWKARARIWEAIYEKKVPYVVLHLCTAPEFYLVDPNSMDFAKALQQQK